LWVTVEYIRSTWFFEGFPWMLSGYALVPFSGLLQIVAWTGVFGLSFAGVAVSSSFAYGVVSRNRKWVAVTAAAAGALSLMPILSTSPPADPLNVRIVQTNIPLDQPWQAGPATQLLDELSHLSSPPRGTARLIVWPETPAPFFLSDDAHFRARMQNIARNGDSYVVLGYVDSIGERPSNSAAAIAPSGEVISRYDKMHLVPFGEYVPLKPLLFWAESFTSAVGDFMPGTEFTITPVDGHHVSTVICYESIFPDQVRQFVLRGSELLVLVTNDGWFGESSAPFQHLRMGVVRSVENRRYMVRSANTGISAIIDPYGRILERTPIGERMILDGTVHYRNDLTFYTRYGDVFAYVNIGIGLMVLALAAYRPE
jgi:apolipoprotein N-acyltransferase